MIGREIRAMRRKHDMTAETLAGLLCVTKSFVSKIESGKRNASKDILEKINRIFDGLEPPRESLPSIGIELRDWLAGMAMQSLILKMPLQIREFVAETAYRIADEMMEVRADAKCDKGT